MPIYDYECHNCGERFERLHRYSDPAPACPRCGNDTRRLPGAAVFHGEMARGREQAMRSLDTGAHGGCCCEPHDHPHPHGHAKPITP